MLTNTVVANENDKIDSTTAQSQPVLLQRGIGFKNM
jgi:hypothetical protein